MSSQNMFELTMFPRLIRSFHGLNFETDGTGAGVTRVAPATGFLERARAPGKFEGRIISENFFILVVDAGSAARKCQWSRLDSRYGHRVG
jgi:hypothetical protein